MVQSSTPFTYHVALCSKNKPSYFNTLRGVVTDIVTRWGSGLFKSGAHTLFVTCLRCGLLFVFFFLLCCTLWLLCLLLIVWWAYFVFTVLGLLGLLGLDEVQKSNVCSHPSVVRGPRCP